jgi:phage baseplate assembly protein W
MATISLQPIANTFSTRNNATVYSDLHLDIAIGNTYNNQLFKQQQILDIQADNNLAAIFNSIVSIITTTPGQKPLNPVFGINFGDLIFLPCTNDRALSIGNAIYQGINQYEPRVVLNNVNVTPVFDQYQYIITLSLTVPRFSTQQVTIVGTLDKSGFFINNM